MKKFDSFLVLDLFEAQKGTQKNMNALLSGTLPLVSAKKIDNGYRNYVTKDCGKVFKGHCLTLNNDGDGGAGLVFYQPSDFALDTHVTALYPKKELTKFQMLYIANCISKQRKLFGHGRSINTSRLEHLTCMLPVNEAGEPDYEYMEEYMKAIEKKLLKRYQEYLLANKKSLKININKCNRANWKPYRIGDILDIHPCRFTGKSVTENGTIPYVGATNRNNGVLNFLNVDSNYILPGNCIVFICNGDGSIGYSIYRKTDFVGSVDVKIGRSKHLNKYVGMFMTTVADMIRPHYSFGYKRTLLRLKNERLILPSTPYGLPDYVYMENYMRAKEIEIINRYITQRLSNL